MAWIAMEFWGKGDPFFGGSADDRPLGKVGEFLRGCYVWSDVAEFGTREAAESAAVAATNRREGGKIGVFERAPAR